MIIILVIILIITLFFVWALTNGNVDNKAIACQIMYATLAIIIAITILFLLILNQQNNIQ